MFAWMRRCLCVECEFTSQTACVSLGPAWPGNQMRMGCAYGAKMPVAFPDGNKRHFTPLHVFLGFKTNKAIGTLEHSRNTRPRGWVVSYLWSLTHLILCSLNGVSPWEQGGVQWQTGILQREINSAEWITSCYGTHVLTYTHTWASNWASFISFWFLSGFLWKNLRLCHVYNLKQQLLVCFKSIINGTVAKCLRAFLMDPKLRSVDDAWKLDLMRKRCWWLFISQQANFGFGCQELS